MRSCFIHSFTAVHLIKMIVYSTSNWYRRGGMGTYLAGTSRVLNAIIGHYLILVWVPVQPGTVYTTLATDQYSAEGFAGCFGPVNRCGHSPNSWNVSQIHWTHGREHGIKRGLPSWMAWYSARDSTFSFEASRMLRRLFPLSGSWLVLPSSDWLETFKRKIVGLQHEFALKCQSG